MFSFLTSSAAIFLSILTTVSGLSCWECEEAKSQADCLRKGKIVECEPDQKFCFTTLRHGGWGPEPWVEKTCKTRKSCEDNYVQNMRPAWAAEGDQFQCNENFPSSVCRCCCQGDMCNKHQTSCLLKSSCTPLKTPKHGKMKCYNGFNLLSQCHFQCKRGYSLHGAERVNCDGFGEWDNKEPTCRRITCPPMPRIPKYGTRKCSDGMNRNSRCRFNCSEGYDLHGKKVLTCIDDEDGDAYGLWNYMPPVCKPKQCPYQRPLRHGERVCTNANYTGSVCSFACNVEGGYSIFPDGNPTELTCLKNQTWDHKRPCCNLPCPPNAVMDLVVVMDSSSSVELVNWNKMKKFVSDMIAFFSIRNDSTHIAAIRYNSIVDTVSQVRFNDFPEDKDGLRAAIEAIPYNGDGTNTGNALTYVAETILTRADNRFLARDLVLLITDGMATDRVAIPSRRLQSMKAEIYILPIQDERRRINMAELRDIVGPGNEDHILRDALRLGFDALDPATASRIVSRFCSLPCFNPFHGHPDDARIGTAI